MTTAEQNRVTRTEVRAFAPAKVNLALHVIGRRSDGYHLLDSLVMFADVGDWVTLSPGDAMQLRVTGGTGVPEGPTNLMWRAAEFFGQNAEMLLEKHLPTEAGIGGGSSDAAATLRALAAATGRPVPPGAEVLGADVPVCLLGSAARMQGVGETVEPMPGLPRLHAVLVNPGVAVSTPTVFGALATHDNPAMSIAPSGNVDRAGLTGWLLNQRNDLEPAAVSVAPVIADVLGALRRAAGCELARMSGSGATCFGLFPSRATADAAAVDLARDHPAWWVTATTLA